MTVDTATLREEAFHLVGRFITRADPGRLEEWATLGLTMTQLRALFLLRAEPALPAGGLAERLGITPSTLTRIVDRLVRHDLIERVPDADDRRLVRHYLSTRGAEVVESIERSGRQRMNELFSRLDDAQLARLVEALRDVNAAGDAIESEPAGVAV